MSDDIIDRLRYYARQMAPSGLGGAGYALMPDKNSMLREAADEIERLRRPAPAPEGWKLIESAPKGEHGTGPRILLWDGFSVFEGFFNGGSFCTINCEPRPHTKMWQPLPSPPRREGEEGK